MFKSGWWLVSGAEAVAGKQKTSARKLPSSQPRFALLGCWAERVQGEPRFVSPLVMEGGNQP